MRGKGDAGAASASLRLVNGVFMGGGAKSIAYTGALHAATSSDMSADDQATTEAAIAAGVERITSFVPELAPPALWVGVWDPATSTYLTAQGEGAPGQPATLDDHFRIGSTTKTFTGAVILQLVDEGALTLDDRIGTLLPALAAQYPEITNITVESLLSMTSSIEDYANVPDSIVAGIVADPTRVWTPEELIAAGLEPGLLPEGTVEYSTTNFIILQLIAESLDGRPLADSIEARLTGPHAMSETSLPIDDPTIPEPSTAGSFNPFCIAELEQDGATAVDITTNPTGWQTSLRDLADGFRDDRIWAVESAQGLGNLLAQQLIAAGETVLDVPAVRAARVRTLSSGRSQKNDPNDARSVAIAALRADDLVEVSPDDHTRILRLLAKRHRVLGRAKNRDCCRLHALLLEMFPGDAGFKMGSMNRTNALLGTFTPTTSMGRQRLEIARDLVDGIERLTRQMKVSKRRIAAAVSASGTSLTEINGLGPITAAAIIGFTGNIDRFPTRHRFASHNATAPIEASSGPKVRHRLNPRGNRQLNYAIQIIAISQLCHDSLGREFYDRKIPTVLGCRWIRDD